ncbi:MAG: type 1 glutamine amidotransferase [Acidimicrobiia bacterium]
MVSSAAPGPPVGIDRAAVRLRVGILACDHVLPEFADIAGDYPDMFVGLFGEYPGVELVTYDLTAGGFPESLGECDGWITTGSRRSVYEDEDWIVRFAELVRAAADKGRPFVGVCFGHQMLAHALGGRVLRSERGWGVGVKSVLLDGYEPWMGDTPPVYAALNSHADQVVEPPPGAEVLGGNDHCPVSIMRVGDRMLGIQGHPEFVPAYSRALMEARRGVLIPDEVVDAGMETLGTPPDTARLADWIVAFLLGSV